MRVPLNIETGITSGSTPYTSSSLDASGIGTGNKTFTTGRLYLWIVATTGTTNPGTVGSPNYTWTHVLSTGNSTRRIQIYALIPTSTHVEQTTMGTFGGGSTGYTAALFEITGFNGTTIAQAIPQSVAGGATGANPTLTLPNAVHGGSAVLGIFHNDANPFGGTPESGWSEITDDGYTLPTEGAYATLKYKAQDNTVNVTAASSTWIGVALEIRGSGRKMVIN